MAQFDARDLLSCYARGVFPMADAREDERVFLIDPDDPAEMATAQRVNDRMIERALAMGGTCTGEHGVGYGKIHCLEAEHGAGVETMRVIKRALDPDNRMNPGKVLRMGNR